MGERLKRLFLASVFAMGLNSGCESAALNRTHFSVQRNPGDFTLIARSDIQELYAYCGATPLSTLRRVQVFSGETSNLTSLIESRGYAQVVIRMESGHSLFTLMPSPGLHRIIGVIEKADASGRRRVIDHLSANFIC